MAESQIDPKKAQVEPNNFPKPGDSGNTVGIVVPKTNPNANPSSDKPETPQESGWWHTLSPWVHGGLGAVSFIPGLSVVSGAIDAGIYTAEGDYVEAALSAASMIPGGKIATSVGKGAVKGYKLVKGAMAAKEAAQLAKGGGTLVRDGTAGARGVQGARDASQAAEQTAKHGSVPESKPLGKKEATPSTTVKENKPHEEPGNPGTEQQPATEAGGGGNKDGNNGAKVKGREKLNCGESGSYGKLQRKTGGGEFARDHIPSKAALKERAKVLLGKNLTDAQAAAIDNSAETIVIPQKLHQKFSRTYGQSLQQASKDANDLAGAAKLDIAALEGNLAQFDKGNLCKDAFKKAALAISKKTNEDYDKWLYEIITKVN